MRARYAAFARAEVDFLLVTGTDTDREGLLAWCRRARFVRLEVQSTEAGGREDDAGFVFCCAHCARQSGVRGAIDHPRAEGPR